MGGSFEFYPYVLIGIALQLTLKLLSLAFASYYSLGRDFIILISTFWKPN